MNLIKYFNDTYSSTYTNSEERRFARRKYSDLNLIDERELEIRHQFKERLENSLKEIDAINKVSTFGRINTEKIRGKFTKYGDSVNYVKKILLEESDGVAKWGFNILKLWNKTHLSFEFLALENDFRDLFTENERNICKKILSMK